MNIQPFQLEIDYFDLFIANNQEHKHKICFIFLKYLFKCSYLLINFFNLNKKS